MNVDRDRNMALKPSYNDKLYLPGLSNTEILILALEASQKLEWNIEEVTPEGIRFEVPVQYTLPWRGNNLYHRKGK